MFVLFIDMEKAFDRFDRQLLWKAISDGYYSIPSKLFRVFKSMYSQNISKG